MWFSSLSTIRQRIVLRDRRHASRRRRLNGSSQVGALESLEGRVLLSAYTAATAADLVNAINAANKHGGTNTITLTAPSTSAYALSSVNNTTNGNNVLPVIQKGDNLTIVTGNGTTNPGYGDTIDASRVGRLFDVASGASLTLENVTLQHGQVIGSGASAEGGAIYNRGTLVLNEVIVQGNDAIGSPGTTSQKSKPGGPGQDAAGGGIWSNGSLTVENVTVIQANAALGGDGGLTQAGRGPGGNAFGGGIYIAGGDANITDSTLGAVSAESGNKAQGGVEGGSAYGGAIYVDAGDVRMTGDTVGSLQFAANGITQNVAQGGAEGSLDWGTAYGGGLYVAGGTVVLIGDTVEGNLAGLDPRFYSGSGYGGGIFIAPGATVEIDLFTAEYAGDNTDTSGTNGPTANIDGTYSLI